MSNDSNAATPPAAPAQGGAAAPSPAASNNNVTLVVDTGAFIRGARLERMGSEFYTLPDVIAEIKDVRTRQAIEALPYTLKFREPTPEAMQEVIRFSKLTGDFAALSVVDLRVLALTYTLEKELNGAEHIKKQPTPQVTVKAGTGAVAGSTAGFFYPSAEQRAPSTPFAEEKTVKPFSVAAFLHSPSRDEYNRRMNITTEAPEGASNGESAAAAEGASASATDSEEASGDSEGGEGHVDAQAGEEEGADSDNEGWITPDNIGAGNHTLNDDEVPVDKWADVDARRRVACVSTDFSLQNVLIQMGLHVLSVDGMLVKRARTFVFKCHACFKITKDMTRQFCGSCGNNTLRRIAISVDENGVTHYHANRNKPVNLRGTKYSIPAPTGGRHNKDLILREDQLKHASRTRGQQRRDKGVDVFDPDYVASASPFGAADPRRFRGADVQVGWGKRNPNEVKRKTGRRK